MEVGKESNQDPEEGPLLLDRTLRRPSSGAQPGRKRLVRSRSVDSKVEPGQVHDIVRPIMELKEKASIHRLPDEMLSEIFSYVDHWDRLVARQVCLDWNRILTTSVNSLTESAVFKIGPIPSTAEALNPAGPLSYDCSLSILNISAVAWRNIKLEQIVLGPGHTPKKFSFGPNRVTEVRGLTLLSCKFTWRLLQELIRNFSSLDKLSLINCNLESVEDDGFFQTVEEVVEFEKFRNRLKELSLKVTGGIKDLNFYMKKFAVSKDPMPLTSLEIEVNGIQAQLEESDSRKFVIAFFGLLTKVNLTLKYLKVTSSHKFSRETGSAFVSFQRLYERMRIVVLHIGWNLSTDGTATPYTATLFDKKLMQFLASQPNLTSLSIPPMSPLISSTEEFHNAVPKKLRAIDIGHDAQLTPELFQRLSTLKALKIRFHIDSSRLPAAINNKIFLGLESLDVCGQPGSNIVVFIVHAFPNLAVLRIACESTDSSSVQITDENLQTIIMNLTSLTSLELSCCQKISDTGLTGIEEATCKTLWKNRSFYLKGGLEDLEVCRTGFPLSSLKGLKELSLKCSDAASSLLTDVGIYFGLDFESLRKLELNGTKKISDLGLVQLGKMNPRLDRLRITSASPRDRSLITSSGTNALRKSLKRVLSSNFSVA